MHTSRRKRRPLDRHKQDFRDDRLYIVACDDTYAPKQYFEAFKLSRLHIHVVPTQDGTSSAEHVLKRLLEYKYEEGDERWMLLDTDHYTKREHQKSFRKAIKEAEEQDVRVALSRPCFEILAPFASSYPTKYRLADIVHGQRYRNPPEENAGLV